jgi:formylglycine-generating enzyme required for sulfatase activity
MSGNVWEWTSEEFEIMFTKIIPRYFEIRGGAWSTIAYTCRVSYFSMQNYVDRVESLGFRLTLPVPKP